MTEPVQPDMTLAAVLHLLIDHGRLPDEATAQACHVAVSDALTPPASTQSDETDPAPAPASA